MEENFLQAGFEIKLACDALSRRVLRWHWEKSARPNSLKELMQYVARRTQEAPDYYTNMATHTGNITWQQLDTTFCVRVLLDSETGAKMPKHLLQYAVHENAARRACNGLRIARNAAAHATDKAGVVKAIAIFDETLGDLEHAYGLTLFNADELEQYDVLIERAKIACGAKATKSKATSTQTTSSKKSPATKQTSTRSAPKSSATNTKKTKTTAKKSTANQTKSKTSSNKNSRAKSKDNHSREKAFACFAAIIFFAALCVQFLR